MEFSEIEKNKLEKFWLDETMREAVKKVIISQFGDLSVTSSVFAGDALQIGEQIKAIQWGLRLFNDGFRSISMYVKPEKKPKQTNPAI